MNCVGRAIFSISLEANLINDANDPFAFASVLVLRVRTALVSNQLESLNVTCFMQVRDLDTANRILRHTANAPVLDEVLSETRPDGIYWPYCRSTIDGT